jgi:predicted TPR repeat methyltransferase
MRRRAHLGARKVATGEPEQIEWSAAAKAHKRSMYLEAAARIRDGLEGRNKTPEVLEMVDGGQGPPSAVIEPLFDTFAEQHDPAKWDRQARSSSTGKYVRTRHKYTPSITGDETR